MNSPWTNFKSNLYRFTGYDFFRSVTSKTLDFTMDSTVEREHVESDKDENDAAVVTLYDQIKARYAPKADKPEELVDQMKENRNLVDKFYAAFEGTWMPESLETWVFFS